MRLAYLFLFPALAVFAADPPPKPLPTSAADLAQGEKLFRNTCGLCHGPKGEGDRGPMLTRSKLRRASDDATLVKIVSNGIRGTEMPGADGIMSETEILQTAAYVRSLGRIEAKPVPGDPAHGAALYSGKGNCTTCHSLHGEGGVAGPDLTGIGERRSADYLRKSLIDPEADIPEGYLLVTLTLKDGHTVTGLRANEDSFSIQLRDSQGRFFSFWKSDLNRIDKHHGKSGMPSFKTQLTEPELTDLIAYLASLKETPTGDAK